MYWIAHFTYGRGDTTLASCDRNRRHGTARHHSTLHQHTTRPDDTTRSDTTQLHCTALGLTGFDSTRFDSTQLVWGGTILDRAWLCPHRFAVRRTML